MDPVGKQHQLSGKIKQQNHRSDSFNRRMAWTDLFCQFLRVRYEHCLGRSNSYAGNVGGSLSSLFLRQQRLEVY